MQSHWQGLEESKESQSFRKKRMSPLFSPQYLLQQSPKLSPGFYLGIHFFLNFFQAMHVTVNNYGCRRNKSCSLVGTAMKWGESDGKGERGWFWNNFVWDNVFVLRTAVQQHALGSMYVASKPLCWVCFPGGSGRAPLARISYLHWVICPSFYFTFPLFYSHRLSH